MAKKIWEIFRWILGISLMLLTIGAFASGDTIAALIVLVAGLLLTPPITKYFAGIFRGGFKIHFPKIMLPLSVRKFTRNLDLENDDNLIQTIDDRLRRKSNLFDNNGKKELGVSVYKKLCELAINTHFIKGEEAKLQKIKEYFQLSDKEILEIKKSLKTRALSKVETLFHQFFQPEYSKAHVQSLIEKMAQQFNLTNSDIDAVNEKVKKEWLDEFLAQKLNLRNISPKDETEIFRELSRLGYSTKQLNNVISVKTLQKLKRGKFLWQLENGILTSIPAPHLNLKPEELCFLSYKAKRFEKETVVNGYSLSGGGLSFPVTKNISLGGALGNAKPIKEEVLNKFEGTLYLTNKRVVFTSPGNNKSFQVNFDDLLSFNLYLDGLEFIVDQNNFLMQFSPDDVELFTTALTSAIRNHLKEDNNIYLLAKAEMEKGENIF